MSTGLETKLNRILNEKTNKIIPENIKKDIQIFDIIGTYEGENTPIELTVDGDVSVNNNTLVFNEEV